MLNPTTLKANALAEVLERNYREVFGPEEPAYPTKLGLAARLVMEILANSDALYHDVDHTMMVALVGQEHHVVAGQRVGDVAVEGIARRAGIPGEIPVEIALIDR